MKVVLTLIVGLFIGYYAHSLRDKKDVRQPVDPPVGQLPPTVSYHEAKIIQADYVDNSPENAVVSIRLTKQNLYDIAAVNSALKYPDNLDIYFARIGGKNDGMLLVPMNYKEESTEESSDESSEGEGETIDERYYLVTGRDPICPPVCDASSPFKYR